MQIRMLRLLKEFFFQQVLVDFALSYCTQNEELLQNLSFAIVIISALRVQFQK